MVVNTRFWSFKELHIRRKVPFVALLLVVLAILLIVSEPPLVLFGFFVLYSLSGCVMAAHATCAPGRRPHVNALSVIGMVKRWLRPLFCISDGEPCPATRQNQKLRHNVQEKLD